MAVINVVLIQNSSSSPVTVANREHPADTDGGRGVLQPGEAHALQMWVPQCGDWQNFAAKHVDPGSAGDPRDRGAPLKPTRSTDREKTAPAGTVSVAGYPDTPIPFAFADPVLSVHVDTASLRAGSPVQVTVHAEDGYTHQPVPATVTIGSTTAPANAALTCTLVPGTNTGTVALAGYRPVTFTLTAYVPAMRVSLDDPSPPVGRSTQVLVHAVDTATAGRRTRRSRTRSARASAGRSTTGSSSTPPAA